MVDGWRTRYGLLAVGLVLSLTVHLALMAALRRAPPSPPAAATLELQVVEKRPEVKLEAPPPPEPEPKPEPPKLEPKPAPKDLTRVKPVKKPPPPNTTAPPKETAEPSRVVAGLTAESFAAGEASAPTFGAGNTLMAAPPDKPAKPEEVQPYAGPVKLADVTTEPVLIGKPTPQEVFGADYPPEAKAQGLEGMTRVKLLIDESGQVREVHGVKGPPLLRRAAEALARRFRYKPATQNGRAVSVWWYEDIPFVVTD